MPAKSPPVYCIVLTMNGKDVLTETLESIHAMTYPNFKVLVVDNGSTDGTQDYHKKNFPWVT